jgi:Major Facilitator Superfamily
MYQDLILFSITLFFWGIGETSFFSFLPIYLEKFGANPLQIGALIGGYGFLGIFVHIPAGYLADRVGRRPLLVAGWVIGLGATILMGLANTIPILTLGMYLYVSTMFVLMSPLHEAICPFSGHFRLYRHPIILGQYLDHFWVVSLLRIMVSKLFFLLHQVSLSCQILALPSSDPNQ